MFCLVHAGLLAGSAENLLPHIEYVFIHPITVAVQFACARFEPKWRLELYHCHHTLMVRRETSGCVPSFVPDTLTSANMVLKVSNGLFLVAKILKGIEM